MESLNLRDLGDVEKWGSDQLFDQLIAVVDTATNKDSAPGSLKIVEKLREVSFFVIYIYILLL